MKQHFFSSVALICAMLTSISAFAQWAEPTPPTIREINADAVESGHAYFIKNVGAGQYLTGGNDWSTKISLTQAGINSDTFEGLSPALAIYIADSTATGINGSPSGVSMRLNGTFTVNGASGARTFTNTYLFRDSEEWGFIDHNTQARGYIWNIRKAESGYWYIQTSEDDNNFSDSSIQYAGWDRDYGEIESDPETGELIDGNTVVYFNMTGEYENECIEWMFIPADEIFAQKEVYKARLALYEKYLETVETAEMEGLDVDMSRAETVYNDPNATVADLNAAVANLTYQVNVAIYQMELEGATPEDPIDITDLVLVNPSFEYGSIDGWKCTFISGQTANNIGYQGASYTNNGSTLSGSAIDEDGNQSYLSRFIEAWSSNGFNNSVVGDGELSQTVYGLPAGEYMLVCDAISTNQYNAEMNPVTGVQIFIATNSGMESVQEIATGNGNPEHFTVRFVSDGSEAITFGLRTQNATANWIAADNFRIIYYGLTLSPGAAYLKNTLATTIIELDDVKCNTAVKDAYISARTVASEMVELDASSMEECLAQAETVKATYEALKTSISDYATVPVIYADCQQLIEEITAQGNESLISQLTTFGNDFYAGYEDGTLTSEDVANLMINVKTIIREELMKDMKAGDDLTLLITNHDFSKEGFGWSHTLAESSVPTISLESWTSPRIDHSQSTEKSYTFESVSGMYLSFTYAVSSEGGCDYLSIYLDGEEIVEVSGEYGNTYSQALSAGLHTLLVRYSKDGSVNSGSDNGTIYDITVNKTEVVL